MLSNLNTILEQLDSVDSTPQSSIEEALVIVIPQMDNEELAAAATAIGEITQAVTSLLMVVEATAQRLEEVQ